VRRNHRSLRQRRGIWTWVCRCRRFRDLRRAEALSEQNLIQELRKEAEMHEHGRCDHADVVCGDCADWTALVLRQAADKLEARAASSPVAHIRPYGGPILLDDAQEQACKQWAADDRLWTTQETVEFNPPGAPQVDFDRHAILYTADGRPLVRRIGFSLPESA
jgi:hypothetical protein